jgi:hypothetical protein
MTKNAFDYGKCKLCGGDLSKHILPDSVIITKHDADGDFEEIAAYGTECYNRIIDTADIQHVMPILDVLGYKENE